MPIQQLPLWDAPPMPTPEPAPSGRPVLPEGGYYPDEVQITQSHWADGDNRPEQLEKLARLRLGDEVVVLKAPPAGCGFARIQVMCRWMMKRRTWHDTSLL